MAIKFVCICGKRLKARDEMAGRRTPCPRCGAPVGIPLLRPTHRGGTLGPMSPAELLKTRRCVPPALPQPVQAAAPVVSDSSTTRPKLPRRLDIKFPGPIAPDLVEQVVSRRPAASPPETEKTRWIESLLYPVRTGLLVLALAGFLACLTAASTLLVPEILERSSRPRDTAIAGGLCALGWLVALGYVCGLLDGALAAGMETGGGYVYWPGGSVVVALRRGGRWLFCLLAGPILPAFIGVLFWCNCGDPTWIDRLIIVELAVVVISHALFTVLSVNENGRLRDANPVHVAEVVHRMGWRAAVAAMAACALVFTHVPVALGAVAQVHINVGVGWLLLALCWASTLFLGALLFRVLGGWAIR